MATLTLPPPTPHDVRALGSPWPLNEAAVYLGVSERHLYRLRDAGKVRVIHIGRRIMMPAEEVQRLATAGC